MIEVFITKEQLEKALEKLNELEERGFLHCLASFGLVSIGQCSSADVVEYTGQLILKGHPDDPQQNWGRISDNMISWYRYEDGELKEE